MKDEEIRMKNGVLSYSGTKFLGIDIAIFKAEKIKNSVKSDGIDRLLCISYGA